MVSFKKIKSFALISVFDKSNLNLLCDLFQKNKIGIVASGSTSNKIRSLGYNCFEISKLTKLNEVLDGRVKTFHPKNRLLIFAKSVISDGLINVAYAQFPKAYIAIIKNNGINTKAIIFLISIKRMISDLVSVNFSSFRTRFLFIL